MMNVYLKMFKIRLKRQKFYYIFLNYILFIEMFIQFETIISKKYIFYYSFNLFFAQLIPLIENAIQYHQNFSKHLKSININQQLYGGGHWDLEQSQSVD